MFELLDRKGIIAFSDTAGANACLSLAFMLIKDGGPAPSLYTNNPNFIDNDWGIAVNYIESIEEVPGDIPADYVFTGTSHPDTSKGFELQFIRLAKRLKIPSVSFIDHWVNFKVRFVINDKTIFPDRVWVLDEKARQAAIAEGLPAEKLVIRENPQNRYLAKYWRAEFLGHSYLHQLGIDTTPETKVVLYAPDPVSLRYQKNEMGFDEVSALKLLMEALSEIAENYTLLLIIKPHPLQREDKLQDMINHLPGNKVRCEIIKKAKNAELINCADVVVGFYSNFLLEAQQLNKPVIRYFPGPQSIDPLGHLRGKLPVVHGNSPFSSLHTYLKHE